MTYVRTSPLRNDIEFDRQQWDNVDAALSALDKYAPTGIMSFGAVGDGVTDDTAAVKKALANGGIVYFPPGKTFKVTSPLTLNSNTHLLFGQGSVLDGSGVASNNTLIGTSGGTTGDANQVALTVDCAKKATTLTIAAGAETAFVVGDYVKIGSQKQWSADVALADNTMDGWRGEIGIISSIASGQLTLKQPTYDAYAVSDVGFVSKMTMVTGIYIGGPGTIIGGGNNTNSIGFKLDRCLSARVYGGLTFQNFDVAAIQCRDGYDVVVDGCIFNGGVSSTTNFYGISWQYASTYCTMHNCVFRDVRHSATLDQIQGIRAGVPRHITYSNCRAYDTKASSFDAHCYGEFLTVIGCHSYNALESGISVRSPSAVIVGNVVVGCGQHGIYLRNQTSEPSRYTVVGNHVLRAGLAGINWRTPPEAALVGTTAGQVIDGVVIADNTIVDPTNEAIICQSASGFTNLYGLAVQGNVVQYTGVNAQNGISMIRVSNSSVTGNVVKGANVGLALDNNCVTVERHGNIYPGSTTPISPGTSVPAPTPVGSLAVSNAAAATTPGSVVKKIQVFDETGTSLGFVPVYSAIT